MKERSRCYLRSRFYRWVVSIRGYEAGDQLPGDLIVLYKLLFPMRHVAQQCDFMQYEIATMTYIIDGVKLSSDVIEELRAHPHSSVRVVIDTDWEDWAREDHEEDDQW